VAHSYDGYRHQVALEVLSADQTSRTFEYQLVGPGTVPADLAQRFAAGSRPLLVVNGTFDTGTGRPVEVRNYLVTLISEPCPTTR